MFCWHTDGSTVVTMFPSWKPCNPIIKPGFSVFIICSMFLTIDNMSSIIMPSFASFPRFAWLFGTDCHEENIYMIIYMSYSFYFYVSKTLSFLSVIVLSCLIVILGGFIFCFKKRLLLNFSNNYTLGTIIKRLTTFSTRLIWFSREGKTWVFFLHIPLKLNSISSVMN